MVGGRCPPMGRVADTHRPRRGDRTRCGQRDPGPARVPRGSRPRLPDTRPCRTDAQRRRGTAHPAGRPARQQPAGRLLRARRTDDRTASTRQPDPAEGAEDTQRQGQHAGGGRARRGHDPPRRSPDRHRAGRRHARWPAGRAGHGRRPARRSRLADRSPAGSSADPSAAGAARGARGRGSGAARVGVQPAPDDPGSHAAQPAAGDDRRSAQAAGRDHRRQWLGQIHARPRRAAGQPAVHQREGRLAEMAGLRQHRGLGLHRPRARGRPDADRQDTAQLPGHLHRLLGHDTQAVCRHAGVACARLRAEPVQLQHRRGPLPGLRRPGHAHDRDEFPARREGALRSVPRTALQPRDAGGHLARSEYRRGARHGDRRGGRLLRQHAGGQSPAAADEGRGPRLPDAGPALTDPERWRSAAAEAGHGADQGARRCRQAGQQGTAHAVRAR